MAYFQQENFFLYWKHYCHISYHTLNTLLPEISISQQIRLHRKKKQCKFKHRAYDHTASIDRIFVSSTLLTKVSPVITYHTEFLVSDHLCLYWALVTEKYTTPSYERSSNKQNKSHQLQVA
eukprot:TRINITY_DN5017_c0_g2_i17.p1 TRINITY_DN5017_c0_g2~~TRINITY_DN5017_c0_g2_i17.p1  ORF type:complete len:121 (+),score=1.11 TRINITY_DN5017_c0_g2_i17:140-502(+)